MIEILKQTKSAEGRDIKLFGDIKTPFNKTILIIGVFHGEEPQGKELIESYIENLVYNGENRVLFLPCLNPDGYKKNKRQNSNGVDLNRNFPTKNWILSDNPEYFGGKEPASEIETKFMIEIIEEYKPDVILSLHAPYKVVNYDGPAENYAEKISEIIKYPTSNDIGYPTPGSFGNYCGVERNIPTITLELDEEKSIEELRKPVWKIFDYLLG